jgi:hypothetical protein
MLQLAPQLLQLALQPLLLFFPPLFLRLNLVLSSVADSGCISRITDPDLYPSQILDPKTATKERRGKKLVCHIFFCSHKYHKIENYFIFEAVKKKFGAIYRQF